MPDDTKQPDEPEGKPDEIDLSDEGDAALEAAWDKLDHDEEFQQLRGTHMDLDDDAGDDAGDEN